MQLYLMIHVQHVILILKKINVKEECNGCGVEVFIHYNSLNIK